MPTDDTAALVDKAEQICAQSAADEALAAVAPTLMDVDRIIARARGIAALRGAKGRSLGKETRQVLEQTHTKLAQLATILEGHRD